MSGNSAQEFLAMLRRQSIELLTAAADQLGAAGLLDQVGPAAPQWTGTAMRDELLDSLQNVAVGDALAAEVLRIITNSLTSAGAGPGPIAALRGWDPDPAAHQQARGIAYAMRAGSGPTDLAVAIATDNLAGARALTLIASGATNGAARLALGAGWELRLEGAVQGDVAVTFAATGAPRIVGATPGDHVTFTFHRADPGQPDVGSTDGPNVRLGDITVSGGFAVDGAGQAAFVGGLRTKQAGVRIAPGGLTALVPGLGDMPLDLDLAAKSGGVTLSGATILHVALPVSADLPGVTIGPVEVDLGINQAGLALRVTTQVALTIPGAPIHLAVSGVGLAVPFDLGDNSNFGFNLNRLVPALPDGGKVDLTFPMVSGVGSFRRTPVANEYSGMLAVTIPPISASAFGVLALDPLSFIVIIGATFPPPGIQIGFGFAITGVGGIIGVGRRVDRDALAAAVVNGTAANLLFPTNPEKSADQVVRALPTIFPAEPGRMVIGPMFQLSWGRRIATASVALILELPEPVRITILGKLVIALPDPAAPLVNIQVTILGVIDTGEPSLMFVASLTGSTIVGCALTGDLFFLARGGADATFILSCGGFHPAYSPPRGVPALHRLGMDLSPGDFLQLRCQQYFTVTSNTIQFGARIDLVAEIAGCGLRGWMGFDVLVQFDPFHFIAQIAAGVAVEVFGETLAGISLSLALEGPSPWRARGSGSVDLFLFSASFDFDETWGDPPPAQLATPDVAGLLAAEFVRAETWVAQPPDLNASPVQLSATARKALADGTVVHPHGRLTAIQKQIPLGIEIKRYNRVPVAPQRWDIADPTINGVVADGAEPRTHEFPAAQFLDLPDDQQLSRPAFEDYRAGITFTSDRVDVGPQVGLEIEWDQQILDDERDLDPRTFNSIFVQAMNLATVAAFDHPTWWQPNEVRVAVQSPGYVVADIWSLTHASDVGPTAVTTYAEAAGLVAAAVAADPQRQLNVVSAFEVAVS